jgi:hypothetical protein
LDIKSLKKPAFNTPKWSNLLGHDIFSLAPGQKICHSWQDPSMSFQIDFPHIKVVEKVNPSL